MDRYSRTVAILKVLLPLAALALLSTLFLISRGTDVGTAIPFAEADLERRTRGQQVTSPFFSGSTAQGDEISVTADLARPGGAGGPATATGLNAVIRMAGGGQVNLTADTGAVHPDRDTAEFIGNVVITSDAGLKVETEKLETALSGLATVSPGPVRASGPIGDLSAGNMRLETQSQGGPMHMLFNNGVKLIYVPQKLER